MFTARHTSPTGWRKTLALGALMTAGSLAVGAAQAAVYDFEGLRLGALSGLDGWVSQPLAGELVIREDDTPANGTLVVQPALGVASGSFSFLTRVNNASFSFSPFFGTETAAVIQFDANAEAAAGFALGRDVDGDGLLGAGEVGAVFGTFREPLQSQANFIVLGANLSTVNLAPVASVAPCCNQDSDWYRLQLRMDLTANGGAGAGSLYYRNLSRGDTAFQPVAALQNVSLHLDAMLPDARPAAWDAMWLVMRFDGAQNMPSLDNLVPRVPVVLQQDMTLNIQSVDALVPFGVKLDLALAPAQVPEDPAGLYWQLQAFKGAESGTASTATMLANWDLQLQTVDVVAISPEVGAVSNVLLAFQGWDGVSPQSMVWKLVSP